MAHAWPAVTWPLPGGVDWSVVVPSSQVQVHASGSASESDDSPPNVTPEPGNVVIGGVPEIVGCVGHVFGGPPLPGPRSTLKSCVDQAAHGNETWPEAVVNLRACSTPSTWRKYSRFASRYVKLNSTMEPDGAGAVKRTDGAFAAVWRGTPVPMRISTLGKRCGYFPTP